MKQMANRKNHYIAVAGVMGSGKTTAAKILSRDLNLPLLEEKPSENPFLESFYKDMPRWALHSQLAFTLIKVRQNMHAQRMLGHTSVIHDGPPGQDKIYLKTNLKLANIARNEYKLVSEIMDLHQPHTILPDPLVVLDAPPDLILNRVAERAREYEKEVPKDYIATLLAFQRAWISRYPKDKKIVIPIERVDVKKKSGKEELVQRVRAYISK